LFAVEEASRSQSETEDSIASPGKETAAKSSLAKDTRDDEQSDDSTDVEDSEMIKQNIVHAGDGDKADSMYILSLVVKVKINVGYLLSVFIMPVGITIKSKI